MTSCYHIFSSFTPIASIHTHTPLTYENSYSYRAVGFSEQDINVSKNSTLILIDYIGTYDIDRNIYVLRGGHPLNAPSKIQILHKK